jgi:hypothetical protein
MTKIIKNSVLTKPYTVVMMSYSFAAIAPRIDAQTNSITCAKWKMVFHQY